LNLPVIRAAQLILTSAFVNQIFEQLLKISRNPAVNHPGNNDSTGGLIRNNRSQMLLQFTFQLAVETVIVLYHLGRIK